MSEAAADNRLASYAAKARRQRSTKSEYRAFLDALIVIVEEIFPCTVRQVFYQAVVRGLVEKLETEYGRVQVGLVKLRETGEIPWSHIADGTRWLRKPDTWDDAAAAVEEAARVYRRSVWRDAAVVPEFWLEKEALAGVVYDVTSEWDVGLYVARGYASLPFLHNSAETIAARAANGKRTAIYHLGDFDPSGRDAARAIRSRLTQFCINAGLPYSITNRDSGTWVEQDTQAIGIYRESPDPLTYKVTEEDVDELNLECVAFSFAELAVQPWQIEQLDLPLRPTKTTDSRRPAFEAKYGIAGSVELDAIHPDTLRLMVSAAIESHMPRVQLDVLRTAEAEERAGLERWARAIREGKEAPA